MDAGPIRLWSIVLGFNGSGDNHRSPMIRHSAGRLALDCGEGGGGGKEWEVTKHGPAADLIVYRPGHAVRGGSMSWSGSGHWEEGGGMIQSEGLLFAPIKGQTHAGRRHGTLRLLRSAVVVVLLLLYH